VCRRDSSASCSAQPLRIMFALRSRCSTRTASSRLFSTSTRLRGPGDAPKPPRSVDDSTSALDYKTAQRIRPPPLPVMDVPRSRTAEEAVTNILYNTPPPSLQPFKKYVMLVIPRSVNVANDGNPDISSTAWCKTNPVCCPACLASSPGVGSISTRWWYAGLRSGT
jgi:hypothetical protein